MIQLKASYLKRLSSFIMRRCDIFNDVKKQINIFILQIMFYFEGKQMYLTQRKFSCKSKLTNYVKQIPLDIH